MFTKNSVLFSITSTKFLAAAISLTIVSLLFSIPTNAQGPSTSTFYPEPIPFSEPDIANPSRGYYKWQGLQRIPNQPTFDEYKRYKWRDIEPNKDQYNFSQIDADIAAAAREGRRYSFRIQPMLGYDDSNSYANQVYVPSYMNTCGWWADYDTNTSGKTFIPNWNNSCYLDRAKALINELSKHFKNNPEISSRVSFIDIGLYGQYGEWTLSGKIDYSKAPAGITPATDTTKYSLIDYHVNAFPDKQLLMFLLYGNFKFIKYAFDLPASQVKNPIGWRVDCLGQPSFFDQWINHNAEWQQIANRWQVAPAVTEFCYIKHNSTYPPTNNNPNPYHALQQTKTFHVSLIGNGNMDDWSTFSTQEQADFITLGKTMGFRLILNRLTITSPLAAGKTTTITTSWSNHGVAPVYEPYQIIYQLYSSGSQPVWQSPSPLVLKSLLPTKNPDSGADNPRTITDSVTIPANLAAGSYQLRLIVSNSNIDVPPLILANKGRQSNGSYQLGTITITSLPSPTGTPTQISLKFKQHLFNWLTNIGDLNSDTKLNSLDWTSLF